MMAPSEDFWNLQSKFRGKKEFNFYDKMVPQPFKITPSPTPTMSPTLTPTPSYSGGYFFLKALIMNGST